jgi:hypothetical protein
MLTSNKPDNQTNHIDVTMATTPGYHCNYTNLPWQPRQIIIKLLQHHVTIEIH